MIVELAALLSAVGLQDVPQGRLVEDRRWGGTAEDTVFASHIVGFALKGTKAVVTMPMIGRVLWFDLAAGSITPVGRPGKGPGEFGRPGTVGWIGDSVWIDDTQNRRVTWLSGSGDLLRTGPLLKPGYYLPLAGGSWLHQEITRRDTITVYRLSPDQRSRTEVLTIGWKAVPRLSIATPSGAIVGPQPFEPVPRVLFDPWTSGLVVLEEAGSPGEARFRRLAPDGKVVGRRMLRLPVAELTEAVVVKQIELYRSGNTSIPASQYRKALYRPKYLPAIRSARVTAGGQLWILTNVERQDGRVWMVFDRDGQHRLTVTAPATISILDVTGDTVYAADLDPDGVASLVRLRLR